MREAILATDSVQNAELGEESDTPGVFNHFEFYEPAAVIGPAEVRVRIMRTNWSAA
jgi:hypothetical protein